MRGEITRRGFLSMAAGLGVGLAFPVVASSLLRVLKLGERAAGEGAWAAPSSSLPRWLSSLKPQFEFAQLKYRGGQWDPYPQAWEMLVKEVILRTSVDVSLTRKEVRVLDSDLFEHPFLYMTGLDEFEPFTDKEVEVLRRFLSYGGFLLADDALGYSGFGFDRSFRELVSKIFPRDELRRLPDDHAVFRSFYLIRYVGGRQMVNPFLEGIDVGDFTSVIYCRNDLGGAWSRDPLGNWSYPCMPGGEAQRAQALRLGVNVMLYVLTADYKKDKIHIPFIEKKIG